MRIFESQDCVVYRIEEKLPYVRMVADMFGALRRPGTPSLLLESVDIAPVYGQLSMFCIDPIVEVKGSAETAVIRPLDERGNALVASIPQSLFPFAHRREVRSDGSIVLSIPRQPFSGEESNRTRSISPALVLAELLSYFSSSRDEHWGLYGAVGYDFVRYFEDIPERFSRPSFPFFRFFIPGSLLISDHIREQAQLITYQVQKGSKRFSAPVPDTVSERSFSPPAFSVSPFSCNMSKGQFLAGVRKAQELMRKGYVYELVLSKKYTASFSGDPFGVYQHYRRINPSPYLFYLDFGDETLLGASPEMLVRIDEHRRVHTRPISGTAPRGSDPLQDYENMMQLLNSSKEKAELDMLIDLGRNDIARVSKPGVMVSDYRFVEKYSRVMHTVAHVSGELEDSVSPFDAFSALLPAGTLTGAPKVEAMKRIELLEPEPRGWYGGAVGYLTFSGTLDSCITIRAAHVARGSLSVQSGATLLLASDPEREWEETEHKARALFSALTYKE